MKRLFVLLAVLMLSFSTVTGIAYAEETKYILINNNSTNLYSDATCNKTLCTLPASYYAQLKSKNDISYEVSFAGATGYIKQSDVSAPQVDALVSSDYTNMVSKLRQYKTTKDTTALCDKSTAKLAVISADKSFTYIGKGEMINSFGEKIEAYYVIADSKVGYFRVIDLPSFSESSIPTYNKPTPTPSTTAETSANASAKAQPSESNNGVVRILLIIGICIPAVTIVYLLFKPAKVPDARYTGDEPKRNDRNEDDDYYQ